MNSNFAIPLEHKSIISIAGADTKNFLQNIISNDIELVTKDQSIYSYLLSPQGKFLYDFIVCQKSSDHYILQCNHDTADELITKLKIYKLRSKIEIEKRDNEYSSLFFNISQEIIASTFNKRKGSAIANSYGIFLNDPRLEEFGIHGIIFKNKIQDLIQDLNLDLLGPAIFANICHNAGLPDQISPNILSNFFCLELNAKELNGVSFKKGCFVGQENTARMNLRNKIRKRVLPVQLLNGTIKTGEDIFYKDQLLGNIIATNPYNFASIKIEDNIDFLNKPLAQATSSIKIIKPYWLQI